MILLKKKIFFYIAKIAQYLTQYLCMLYILITYQH